MAKIRWYSRKGQGRKQNCDVAGVIVKQNYLFAVVADAAENSGRASAEYVYTWIKQLIDNISISEEINQNIVLEKMQDAYLCIRQQFLKEKACYCALLIDFSKSDVIAYSCGDCRVGWQYGDECIRWFSVVHSIANWKGEEFSEKHAASPNRHIVTKSLNAKRFNFPDMVGGTYKKNVSWILATDGYWVDHQMQAILSENLIDDSSVLNILVEESGSTIDSDCDNWYWEA